MCGELIKKTQTKKGTCKGFDKVKDKTDIKIKQDDGYTYKYLLETKCVTKEEILKKHPIAKKSTLIQEYDNKEVELNEEFASKIELSELRGTVYVNKVCSTDVGEKYGIAVINMQVDEYTKMNGGYSTNVKGITKKVDYHIIDLKTGKALYKFGPTTWRDGDGVCTINYKLAYNECKILKETDSKVVFGLKTMGGIKVLEFSKKEGKVKTLEDFDLSEYKKVYEVQEKIDKALGLETGKKGYIDESSLLRKILEDTIDWGGHAGSPKLAHEHFAVQAVYQGKESSKATVKLVVKDVGIFDINEHVRLHEPSSGQYGFYVEYPSVEFVDGKIVIKYDLEEKTGFYFNTCKTTKHAVVIDPKLLGPEYEKIVKIKEKSKELLSHGNLHKIPILKQGFGDKDEELSNYAYSVKQFTHKDEKYVLVTKMIDVESYQKLDLQMWQDTIAGYEAQLKMGLYKVKETSKGEIELECVDEITTSSTDRKEIVYNFERGMKMGEIVVCPEIKIEGDGVKIILDAINPESKQYNLIMDEKEFVLKF
jgi:hypothetical protein